MKEHHAGRVEDADRCCVEQTLIEGPCTRKVIDVLRDLKDVHCASFAWSTAELRDQARCLVIRTKIAAAIAVGVSLLLIALAVLVADAISPGECVLRVANTALDAPSA